METPIARVEDVPPDEFWPPHCPRRGCPDPDRPANIRRHSSFARKCDGRRVPRFYCRACRGTFSQQTFACTYYLKRPELLELCASLAVAGCGHRQIARSVKERRPGETCAHSTVTLQLHRAARHCILLHQKMIEEGRVNEPTVLDDFQSFAGSQFFPYACLTGVGAVSRYTYSIDLAQHRRGGHLNEFLKKRQAELDARHGKVPRGERGRRFTETLDLFLRLFDGRITVIHDGHEAYKNAERRHPERDRIDVRIFPNPKRGPKGAPRSRAAAERDRAMFPVDQLHALLRHSRAHHRRETLAFARRHCDAVAREFITVIWRNAVKQKSERKPDGKTPAMEVGITKSPWCWNHVFAERLFPHRMKVEERWMRLYRREEDTLTIKNNRRHALVYAY